VRVKQELGNGDLYVEGTKVVMVGEEEHHIYLSGIVRTADISRRQHRPVVAHRRRRDRVHRPRRRQRSTASGLG
jgi:hypothetical protein